MDNHEKPTTQFQTRTLIFKECIANKLITPTYARRREIRWRWSEALYTEGK
jgi:hypothetical protein